jgi:hypothetical protein
MKNPKDELIWKGQLHIGDEPGVYGVAHYVGLCTEFPLTIRPFDPTNPKTDVTFLLESEDVSTYTGYPGHAVSLIAYEPTGPNKWKQVLLGSWLLTQSQSPLQMSVPDLKGHQYFSLQVRVDTTVQPGLYNDFLLTRLALQSTTHYASFGFGS